jgi:RNA polymerase sigma-70 factor (ECF subfamily)
MPDELIPTRATLLQRLKNWQDQSSWQDFFDTYWNLIYGVARKGGLTPAEAEDVVQETMVSVAKHMPGFKYDPAIGSFKGWLLKMTRWRIVDQLRKRGGHNLPVETDLDETDLDEADLEKIAGVADSDLEKIWDAEWEGNLLNAATAKARRRLDPQHYQIFDCYVNKEWPPDKISKIFSISVGQVYLAKHRVTEAIKLEVERLKNEMI